MWLLRSGVMVLLTDLAMGLAMELLDTARGLRDMASDALTAVGGTAVGGFGGWRSLDHPYALPKF